MANEKILEKPAKLIICINEFFKREAIVGKRICLGYSGGIDSTALLDILRNCQKFVNFTLSIAHVNHGWRKESNFEMQQIQKFSEQNALKAYLYTIPNHSWRNNIEDRYRRERLHFFQKLYLENAFDILILAHHAEDAAETTLKRVLEGATLTKLRGLREKAFYQGMPIYRPLLSVRKRDLIEYVKNRNLTYFDDNTNSDQKYLRNRIRHTLLPLVERYFQKGISKNLLKLSARCRSLEDYLVRNTEKFYAGVYNQTEIITLDFSSFSRLEPIEVDFFLRRFFESVGVVLSSSQIATIVTCLIENKYDKRTHTKNFALRIHGKILYIEPIR